MSIIAHKIYFRVSLQEVVGYQFTDVGFRLDVCMAKVRQAKIER